MLPPRLDDFALFLESALHCALRAAGLSSKHLYSVLVVGTPLWWSAPEGGIEETGGFYTTRNVMARSPEAAISRVKEMVGCEASSFARNPPESPLRIEVEKCDRLRGWVAWRGAGFSFWVADESEWERLTGGDGPPPDE
jgi:hypothetical protein